MTNFITYLALEHFSVASASDTLDAMRSLVGEMPIEAAVTSASPDAETFMITVNGLVVTVMFIDKPLPKVAWSRAASLSIAFRNAAQTLKPAKAHVIVALLNEVEGHTQALNGALAVTLISGALATKLPIVATVFSESQSVLSTDQMRGAISGLAARQLPTLLWTTLVFDQGDITVNDKPTVEVRTIGLSAFIGRELETTETTMATSDVAARLYGVCQYLLTGGEIIKDGETFGLDEKEKVRVRYLSAGKRVTGPVMSLVFPRPCGAAP